MYGTADDEVIFHIFTTFFWVGNHEMASTALVGAEGLPRLLRTKTHPRPSFACARYLSEDPLFINFRKFYSGLNINNNML